MKSEHVKKPEGNGIGDLCREVWKLTYVDESDAGKMLSHVRSTYVDNPAFGAYGHKNTVTVFGTSRFQVWDLAINNNAVLPEMEQVDNVVYDTDENWGDQLADAQEEWDATPEDEREDTRPDDDNFQAFEDGYFGDFKNSFECVVNQLLEDPEVPECHRCPAFYVEGRSMGWRRRSGCAVLNNPTVQQLIDAVTVNGDYTLHGHINGQTHTLEISLAHHDGNDCYFISSYGKVIKRRCESSPHLKQLLIAWAGGFYTNLPPGEVSEAIHISSAASELAEQEIDPWDDKAIHDLVFNCSHRTSTVLLERI